MTKYQYKCNKCELVQDIDHPMSEVGNLSEETVNKIVCGKCTIEDHKKLLTAPTLLGSVGGKFYNETQRGNLRKGDRRMRSKKYFKDNVLPGLSGWEKQRHEERLKKEGI